MSYADYNWIITINEHFETVIEGDVAQGYISTSFHDARAKVTQIDGTRLLKDDELIDRACYKIECWDPGCSNDIQIIFEGKYLYPIKPIVRNPGKGNFTSEMLIYAASKVGQTGVIITNDDEMKYPISTINLSAGVERDVTTSLTAKPYNVQLLDSSGNVIESTVDIRVALSGGVYHIYVTSSEALTNVELYILY
jgi:hypothetical protein